MAIEAYQQKLRVRVSGILVQDDAVCLLELKSPINGNWIWIAPGGGVDFGETLEEALVREFQEETNLKVGVEELVHINELVADPYHALEFYFKVQYVSGEMKLGSDPEHDSDSQLIRDLRFIPISELDQFDFQPKILPKLFEYNPELHPISQFTNR